MKDRLKGKVEEAKGRLTGDRVEELKGKARQKVGEGKQAVDELRARARQGQPARADEEVLDDHRDETPESI
jgi:uncharacterized protein YjbJ (UPF0337 family)